MNAVASPATEMSQPVQPFSVTAVRYGRLQTSRAGIYLNYSDYGQPDVPASLFYYFWVIRNQDRTIVFDTGFRAEVGRRRGREVLVDPVVALEALGVPDTPETLVVISHGHYDHIGNLDQFTQARFVMHDAEYRFWVEGPRQHLTEQLIERSEIEHLQQLRASGRLELVSDEQELCPGLSLLHGFGHTPGELMLLVDTEVGPLLLTADAVHTDEELAYDMPFRHMCDIVQAASTYKKIRAMVGETRASRAFAGHEIADFHEFPVDPRLPEHARLLSAVPSIPGISSHLRED